MKLIVFCDFCGTKIELDYVKTTELVDIYRGTCPRCGESVEEISPIEPIAFDVYE